MNNKRKSICPYDCPQACGLEITLENEQIVKVEGDKEHPVFKGLICHKMRNYQAAIYNKERILTPLKRIGKKGEGMFQEVSWEQAIQEITDHWHHDLQEYGPDAILGVSSSGTQGLLQKNIVDALFNKIGGRKVEMTLCSGAKTGAFESLTNNSGSLCPSQMMDSDYYLVWSSNVRNTRLATLALLTNQRKQGKKIVNIDVFTKDNASYFDENIQIRPGSDGALALAMMHILVQEGYSDDIFMQEFCVGYEEFRDTLIQYTPEWAEPITGIDASTIRRIAREFGKAKSPCILLGTGMSRRLNGGMNTRLVIILSAITGAWKKEGGGFVGRNPRSGPCIDLNKITNPQFRKHNGKVENINLLSNTFQDSSLHSLYISGANPVHSIHNQKGAIQGLKRDDLFCVVHDRIHTATTKYADIILPATYSVEHSDLYMASGFNTFSSAYQITKPLGQAKSNWDTICLLAKGMGYTEEIFSKNVEEMMKELLENPLPPLNQVNLDILHTGGSVLLPYPNRTKLKTADGKMHIYDAKLAYPLPQYVPNLEDDYPLSLVCIPDFYTLNSVFDDRKDLLKKRGECIVYIHPEDARTRNIKDRDSVLLYNDLGSFHCTCSISPQIVEGCVAISGSFPFNLLHHARISDMGKGTTLNDNRVEMKKCAKQ
ncbi:MAG: molybdopterin-dependent oxidoreductase [Bacillota bacterium]|nr:molybdopterin-dependent oxidoreductase [Bacillota bacterium]